MNDKAPDETSLMVCPVCGRTDRFATLGRTKHYRGGGLCPGEPIKVAYLSLSKVRERLERFADQLETQILEGDGPSDLTSATVRAVKAQGIRDALAASFPGEDQGKETK